jgi:hypothetical protein
MRSPLQGALYMDKLAVHNSFRGLGIAELLWQKICRDVATMFWRSRPDNTYDRARARARLMWIVLTVTGLTLGMFGSRMARFASTIGRCTSTDCANYAMASDGAVDVN